MDGGSESLDVRLLSTDLILQPSITNRPIYNSYNILLIFSYILNIFQAFPAVFRPWQYNINNFFHQISHTISRIFCINRASSTPNQ